VKDLMQRFVCVRVVQMNGVDLSLFQFDYDLTFCVLFMNADRTIYGRFGTRSTMESAHDDITLDGFRAALAGALELHAGYPDNRRALGGKQGVRPRFKTPDDYPPLAEHAKKATVGEAPAMKGCIHCHQVREAERQLARSARRPMTDDLLFPFPLPDVVGLKLDPREMATVERVAGDSAADAAGFRSGDRIVALDGQPAISAADVQWVLHHAGSPATIEAEVQRGNGKTKLKLALADGWRRAGDLSWRPTTWDLRRMGAGGLVLEDLGDADRRKAGLTDSSLALRIKHVGEYGDHAVAKRAGFQKGDVIVELDGASDRLSETGFLAYTVQQKLPRDQLAITVLRGQRRVELKLPLQ
jgi:hypothetical protein